MARFNRRACLLSAILLVALVLSGCQMPRIFPQQQADQTPVPASTIALNTPTPMPGIDAEPAPVITGVETDKMVVSLILEGYTDDSNVIAIADALAQRGVPATFFFAGVTADEHPNTLSEVVSKGFDIGCYGMNGSKMMEKYPAYQNAQWFSRAKQLIQDACGYDTQYVRCNGSVYTDDLLSAVTAAGFKAAVEPTAYINHRSFRTVEEAGTYAASVLRGSILTIKLGQELDEGEYGDAGDKLDERPAIDPSPGVLRDWEATEERFVSLPEMVGWLVDALKAQGYTFLPLGELGDAAKTLLPRLRDLTREEQQMLSPLNYSVPVTDQPLTSQAAERNSVVSLDSALIVGDSVMAGLSDYVEWRRETKPNYMSGLKFITDDGATVESMLAGESGSLAIEDRIALTNAKSVWLCLGFSSADGYKREAYLTNYRLLIYRIQKRNPNVRVVVMSIPPKMEGYSGTGNPQRFNLNLMLCGMCRQYGLDFVDAAFPLRDETGALRQDYCLDMVTYGKHLNDIGCEAVLDFLLQHQPA